MNCEERHHDINAELKRDREANKIRTSRFVRASNETAAKCEASAQLRAKGIFFPEFGAAIRTSSDGFRVNVAFEKPSMSEAEARRQHPSSGRAS